MPKCRICGSVEIQTKRVRIRFLTTLHKCQSCKFAWTEASESKEAEALYNAYPYNLAVHGHHERMKGLYLKGFRERIERSPVRASLQDSHFLDIGCANGEFLCAAKECGFGTVMGVEVDAVAAARARSYGQVESNADLLPEGLTFDVIQIKNVLSNISDVSGMMRAAMGRLRRGGILWLDVLNDNSLTSLRRKFFRGSDGRYGTLRPPFVVNAFRRETVKVLLESSGLRVLRCHTSYMGHGFVPYNSSLAWEALGRVSLLFDAGAMLISDSVLD